MLHVCSCMFTCTLKSNTQLKVYLSNVYFTYRYTLQLQGATIRWRLPHKDTKTNKDLEVLVLYLVVFPFYATLFIYSTISDANITLSLHYFYFKDLVWPISYSTFVQ